MIKIRIKMLIVALTLFSPFSFCMADPSVGAELGVITDTLTQSYLTEASEIIDAASASETTDPSEVFEVVDRSVASEGMELPLAPVAVEASEIIDVPHRTQAIDTAEEPEVVDGSVASGGIELPLAPVATEASEIIDRPNANERIDLAEEPDAPLMIETPEITDTANASETTDPSEVFEVADRSGPHEVIDPPPVIEASEVIDRANANERIDLAEEPEVPDAPLMIETPEIIDTANANERIDLAEEPEVPDAPLMIETPEIIDRANASETTDPSEVFEVADRSGPHEVIGPPPVIEASEVIDRPNANERIDLAEEPEVPDAPVGPEASEIIDVANDNERTDPAEESEMIDASSVTEASEITHLPNASDAIDAVEEPEIAHKSFAPEAHRTSDKSLLADTPFASLEDEVTAFAEPSEVAHPIFKLSTESKLEATREDIEQFYKNTKKPYSAKSWYALSQLNIKANNLDEASKALLQSITKDPNLVEAHIQLGYVYLMQKNYEDALKSFNFVIDNFSCNKFVYSGLVDVAHYYEQEKATREVALTIYQKILTCLPENPDYYLYTGRLLNWMDKPRLAKQYLQKTLELVPDYYGAAAILANIYIQEGLYEKAESLYSRFPKNSEAISGLANIAYLRKKDKNAQSTAGATETKELANPIFEVPTAPKLAAVNEAIEQLYKNTKKPYSAESWYALSQLNIKANNLDEASKALLQSISKDPSLVEAHIQLGYVYLMQKNYEDALKSFNFVIGNFSCNKFVYSGLVDVAHYYEQEKATREVALTIYQKLLTCLPENPDYYLYIGRLLNWMDQPRLAKQYLEKTLELVPDYYGAAAILANIYIQEKLYHEAESLYYKFPDNIDAMAGLANIAFLQKNYRYAQYLLEAILQEEPENTNARRELARSLYNQQHYRKARKQFLSLINKDPCDDKLLREYAYSVKPYTNLALVPELTYTKAKENDRSLKKPVVRNLYVMASLKLDLPLNDQWKVDTEGFFFRQKEKDIYPPVTGNNYNVYMSGARIASHVYHSRAWRWDLSASLFKAWSQGEEFYPFSDTASFEPATYAIYDDDRHLIVVGGNYGSFVIKNFSTDTSELLRFVYTEGRYGYRFKNLSFEPEISGWLSWSFYNDPIHNRKESQSIYLESKVPGAPEAITLTYLAEHSGFAKLSRNYFSYARQWLNILGIRLHHEISTRSYIELMYEQRWRSTRNLFLPVGDTVFVARNLFIRGHRPSIKIGHRYRDKVTIELSGHYYRDTFPYRDYGFKTKVLWYF